MPLFSKKKTIGVQSFILKVVNNSCPELRDQLEGPRLDRRVNLTLAVAVVPLEGQHPRVDRAFTAVTKEFSTSGLSLVLDTPLGLDEILVGFRWEGHLSYVRGKARHLNPIGGGFYQLGIQLTEMAATGDYCELEQVCF